MGSNKFDRRNRRRQEMALGWNGRPNWGKGEATQESPHKNDPTPVMGGCGNPNCDICYEEDGQLKGGGRFVVSGASDDFTRYSVSSNGVFPDDPRLAAPQDPEAARRAAVEARLATLRVEVKKYLLKGFSPVQWEDVVGNELARSELRDAIEASTTHAEVYRFYEMKPPKGVMLFGPPGCGKTMLAKATATAVSRLYGAESELLVINGAELEAPVVGIAAQRVKSIFAYARAFKEARGVPLTIFIDEADAVLKSRETAPWTAELVGTMLGEMDGLQDSGAFVILATNRPDELDQALLREGRIDRKIRVTRPSPESVREILRKQFAGAPSWLHAVDVDLVVEALFDPLKVIRVLTHPESNRDHHFTLAHIVNGAMVTGLIDRAKSVAFRRDVASGVVTGVTQDDILAAVDAVFEENKGLDHSYALVEFVTDVALPAEMARNRNLN